ncbi:Flp family type IVb pilin [Lentilitoribacter sp. EG35]|uniref:Flp family type IVb pilin n=1 Tax=Lentilitoribacter sp. EG35 TaxID=3234192 RepID=UPI0034605BD9
MTNLIKRFTNDESGATAIEYGLIAGLIAVAIIAGAGTLGNALDNQFDDLATEIENASPST